MAQSIKRVENSWLLVINEKLFEANSFTIIALPHPATGNVCKYCMDDNNIYEIVTYDESYRSWFIEDQVKSDSNLHLVTPINPLFLVLPKLKQECSKRAMPLEDLLSEKGYDKIVKYVKNLDLIADLKGPVDIQAYKYNETKTLDWLEARVRTLAKVLRDKNIHVLPGAASATFIASTVSDANIDDEFYLKYAHGIISDYLEEELSESLEKRFKFKSDLIESLGKKRKSDVNDSGIIKKIKVESSHNTKDNILVSPEKTLRDVKKATPLNSKEKARLKAANGMKTISSFFKK